MNERIVPGSQYQFDLEDLAFVGNTVIGIQLVYKQGAKIDIGISDPAEREKQYKIICDIHRGKIKWQDL